MELRRVLFRSTTESVQPSPVSLNPTGSLLPLIFLSPTACMSSHLSPPTSPPSPTSDSKPPPAELWVIATTPQPTNSFGTHQPADLLAGLIKTPVVLQPSDRKSVV